MNLGERKKQKEREDERGRRRAAQHTPKYKTPQSSSGTRGRGSKREFTPLERPTKQGTHLCEAEKGGRNQGGQGKKEVVKRGAERGVA